MVTIKEFFSLKSNGFFWLNLIAMVIVVVASAWGALEWLDRYTHHGESYVVSDVKNKSLLEAKAMLAAQNLRVTVVDSNYVKGLPAGVVLDQAPVGGMRVKEGRNVYLTINTNEVPLVNIPDVIDNSSYRQAAAKLKAMGFKLTEPELVAGEQDWIYGIKYKGKSLEMNDKVPHEALLTLCVGNVHLRDSLNGDSMHIDLSTIPSGNDSGAPEVDESWF